MSINWGWGKFWYIHTRYNTAIKKVKEFFLYRDGMITRVLKEQGKMHTVCKV